MATASDFIGIWRGDAMFVPDSQIYEELVFHMDGTGFLDFYESGRGRAHYFRWSVMPDGLDLAACHPPHEVVGPEHASVSISDALIAFRIETEEIDSGRVRCLMLANKVVSGASLRFRYGGDCPAYATFQADCFPRRPDTHLFQGEAVAQYLADQLQQCGTAVGEVRRVFFGACHYFCVDIAGHRLGVGANWDTDLDAWWLRIDPPMQGRGDEVESLCQMLRPILESVDGLHDLEWHNDDPWEKSAIKNQTNQ